MKFKSVTMLFLSMLLVSVLTNCTNNAPATSTASNDAAAPAGGGQSAVQDDDSQKDVVKVAASSKDHSTLVAAVKAAELVDALSNAGPFTVFAPTNAAFEKLPAGTVEGLLKPEKKADLQDILQYHVALGVFKTDMFQDGQSISVANGGNLKIGVSGGKVTVNGANIIATVPASNGIIHVIDGVLLPQ
ncbi:MAG: fasciclin domain-containing protein [Saprospiraceae bacterium]|nr:fasciclin domain-containing protein [Saprospiraceae bacterium]